MSTGNLILQIQTTDGSGVPTGVVLASSLPVSVEDVSHDAFYAFPFATPLVLPDESSHYAAVLVEQGAVVGEPEVGWVTSTEDDPYADGEKFIDSTGYPSQDFFFKIFYDAPQQVEVSEHIVAFDQSKAIQFFVSTDNTMELDMRFMVSFCIDGTGTMAVADAANVRRSEAYLFAREVMRRAPESYIDVWVFDDTIYENTPDGPTNVRQVYAAALGSIYSTGDTSRLWAAAQQAVGNLEPTLAVQAIVRDEDISRVLELMRQMNRIDYDELATIDSTYDPATGFSGISGHGRAIDYLIQSYAETMGRHAIIVSDGFDTVNDTDPEDVAILANAVIGDGLTPVHAISMGPSHWSEDMLSVAEETGGMMCQVGVNVDRMRECFNYLLNDASRMIFQGSYEDTVEFDELTYLQSIELGAIVPLTSDLTFQISVSYDGVTYGDWETLPANSRNDLRRFVWGIKYRIRGWLGNLFGGNYYDIYGFDPGDDSSTVGTAGCRYTRYYYAGTYSYTYEEGDYYYRNPDYPSPKVYSLRYWTVSPAVTYNFTTPQTGGPVSEYALTSTLDLPRTARLRWGIVRGDSTDFADAELAIANRRGVLPNRTSEIYFTPDVSRIGLDAVVQDQNRVLFKIFNEDGTTATWTSTDEVVVYSKGVEVDVVLEPFQLDGEHGFLLFKDSRTASDMITLDITTPGHAASTRGEICTTTNQRMYYAKSGSWPWDASTTVMVNGIIRRDGYVLYPSEGVIFFKRELDPSDLVTIEIDHSGTYRVGYELSNYDDEEPVDPPDFGLMFSRTPQTDTLFQAGLTSPPEASNVTLLPSGMSIDSSNPDAVILVPTTSRLVVDYEFYQAEGNAEGSSLIEWYYKRTGEDVYTHYAAYDGRNVMRLSETVANSPSGPFMEGDHWYAEVTPVDANSVGVVERSNIVLISDKMPPYITSAITIASGDTLATALTTTVVMDLEARYTYVDPNLTGDQTVSDASVIEWYKKGSGKPVFTSDSSDKVLPAAYQKPKDVWFYVVTPYDGVNYGDPFQSDDVTITQEEGATA